MSYRTVLAVAVALSAVAWPAIHAQNLILNGTFDDPEDPLKGWNVDYAWEGNRHYVGNASRVAVIAEESGRRHVARLRSPGDAGVRLESMLIPFEAQARYRANLRVKGGPYRIYFAGYQWRPGIRPHDAPTLPEMRQVYRSRAETGQADAWRSLTLDIPGTAASELSLQHLRRVRFVSLYIWFQGDGFVDDVIITRENGR